MDCFLAFIIIIEFDYSSACHNRVERGCVYMHTRMRVLVCMPTRVL